MLTFKVPFFMGEFMDDFNVPEPHHEIRPDLPDGAPQERMGELYRRVAEAIATDASLPAVYSGDCVSIIGVTAGLQRRGIEPTLVFFDAHGDFHTWETTHSDFIGGMPLAMITGRGEQTVLEAAGTAPLPDDRTWLVDGRDLDDGEWQALAESGVRQITVTEIGLHPPPGDLYVHVDVDVVDPAELPAVNYPAPGGPALEAVVESVRRLAETGRVVAFSLSSWNPALNCASVAAAASHRIAAPFLA